MIINVIMNQNPYLVLVLLMAAAVCFALTPLAAAWAWAHFFSPQKPGRDKNDIKDYLGELFHAWLNSEAADSQDF